MIMIKTINTATNMIPSVEPTSPWASVIRETSNKEEKMHFVHAAQRYLQSGARGVERTNGAKVLA